MYRADRFTRVEHSNRGPVVATVSILIIVAAFALACGTDRDEKKTDPTVQQPTTPSTPPTVGGEVAQSNQPKQVVTFASAQDAYTKHHYREATESFDDYVQQHPKNAFGYYMLGLSAWKSGDLDRAHMAFEESIALDSTNVKTLLNLGRVLLDQGKPEDAFARISTAVQLDTSSAEVRRMMGRVESARGQRDSAIASYRVALSMDPADSWSMNNLGLLLIEQGRYEEALPPLARAVEIRPEAPAFANNLGVALERTGHPSAAAEAFRSALKADSTYSKATVSLARVEEKAKSDTTTVDVSGLASDVQPGVAGVAEFASRGEGGRQAG